MSETATVSQTAVRHTLDEIKQAIESADAERAAACYAEDAHLRDTLGEYRGRAAIVAFYRWSFAQHQQERVEQTGMGWRILGDAAVGESVARTINKDGVPLQIPMLTYMEFNGAGQITRSVSYKEYWTTICQGAEHVRGLRGRLLRAVTGQIDRSTRERLPASTRT